MRGAKENKTPEKTLKTAHVDKANAYVEGVITGVIPACKWVVLACKRHVEDLRRADAGNWHYRFDVVAAEKVCIFVELMPHTKGEWAARGEKLVLEPWQCFILCSIFGWLNAAGKRRYRRAYIEVCRKNGKSAISSAIGLYMLAADGEHGAEVYSGGPTEKTAWEVFLPALEMAKKTPQFVSKFGITINASNIHIAGKASKFEPMIGKPNDGASPSCAIIDEFHQHKTSAQRDTMITGMGARSQPLLLIITTAGEDISGACYDERLTCQKVLEGFEEEDERFGIVFTIDEGDDWTSELALRKANPNFGVSISAEFLLNQQRSAVRNARDQGVFKTRHLDVWVQSKSAAFNMEKWREGYDKGLRIEDFYGRRAWLGLDLASEVDIAALEVLIEDGKDNFIRFGYQYLPEGAVNEPKNKHYKAWELDGKIKVTDGAVIDFMRIEEDILALTSNFTNVEVAYDQYQATMLVTRLMAEGVSCLKYPMNTLSVSPAMKRLDAMLMSNRLRHNCDDKDPMTWMMSNVVGKLDANDNVYPRKERVENKIDGPVALMMAIGRAMTTSAYTGSIYDPEYATLWGDTSEKDTEGDRGFVEEGGGRKGCKSIYDFLELWP
ncbi:COG4626 Phage terminase-like protein, large subunit [uncultured Caudovirales phage]|uniref:COG4626 Phage terminase-like protein, large subunit n=1 Tax=uncultured Caudovirales phage TaxID=2100421 RepID=A0A6J5RG54_9CAUD|nr:COG4626 Phage terminase-like protein, large subunit [uncultured Caudovirales phage]